MDTLSWKKRVQTVVSDCMKRIGLIKHCFKNCNQSIKLKSLTNLVILATSVVFYKYCFKSTQ